MSETGNQQRGSELGSLREMCEHYRIQQRAKSRLGLGIKPTAVQLMMAKIKGDCESLEGLVWKR